MSQNNEYELPDFLFLNDVNVNNRFSSEELDVLFKSFNREPAAGTIEIFGENGVKPEVVYTYAKFFEILDTQGLSGLVNY